MPGKRPRSDQDLFPSSFNGNGEPTPLDFESDNYIIKKEIGSGCQATVSASIPKYIADPIYEEHSSGTLTKDEACTKLRAALQAVKVSKPTNPCDFQTEIEALQGVGEGRPHIAKIVDSDTAHNRWLTVEMLTGGSLSSLVSKTSLNKRNPNAPTPPDAFGWHLIHNLTEAFLEFHFGTINGVDVPELKRFVHGDMSEQNLMFRCPGSFKDYPDIVIIDLGRAHSLDLDDKGNLNDQFKAQANDIIAAAECVRPIFRRMSPAHAQLGNALKKLLNCFPEDNVDDGNEQLKELLLGMRKNALQRRQKLYWPLEQELVSLFTNEVVSDTELLAPSARLLASVSGSSPTSGGKAGNAPRPAKKQALSKREVARESRQARQGDASSSGESA